MSIDSGVRIRSMRAADIDRLMEIAASLDDAPHWPRQVYESLLDPASRKRVACVAEASESGGVVGFAVAGVVLLEAELESIAISREYQRHGVGRRLLASLAEELGQSGVNEVLLEVRESNAGARAFYRSLGFAEEGQRSGYYADPVEDAVLLRLRLD